MILLATAEEAKRAKNFVLDAEKAEAAVAKIMVDLLRELEAGIGGSYPAGPLHVEPENALSRNGWQSRNRLASVALIALSHTFPPWIEVWSLR